MKLLILHYHLNRGGVTRVIENHCRALATQSASCWPEQVIIVYGGRANGWDADFANQVAFPVELAVVPALDYDDLVAQPAADLHAALTQVLNQYSCQRHGTVIMVHNHSLGKNTALPAALGALADGGWPILLQVHDFAEDLRPANYQRLLQRAGSSERLRRVLYPQAPHVHYAVLNGRDDRVFTQAGVPRTAVHHLPNPVETDVSPPAIAERQQGRLEVFSRLKIPNDHRYIVYPVRGIRRKNLGELLLWSALVPHATFATTLAPLNPVEKPSYLRWVRLAQECQLPVRFDVGQSHKLSLSQNLAASDAVITTSVAEGFGLVYLEASLAGRPLLGRSLPGITDDFQAAGICFPGLANGLFVPASWVDRRSLVQRELQWAIHLQQAFQLPPTKPDQLLEDIEAQFSGTTVDFGRLDSTTQTALVRRVHRSAQDREALRKLNPVVGLLDASDFATDGTGASVLDQNRRVIRQTYSLPVIGKKLHSLLNTVVSSPPTRVAYPPEVAASILAHFVQPSQLFPIRLETWTNDD